MKKCIDSILTLGEDVEIIVVNDGSRDDTAKIAAEYQEKYPTIVKAINKENGGHGSGVNCGIENASGLYFKVVDSDDWIDEEAAKTLLETIKKFHSENNAPDLIINNYVYEHVEDQTQLSINYKKSLPTDKIFTWDEVKSFGTSKFLLMHSLCYQTRILRECGLKLPEHTFYVDNIFAYKPLPFVKTMYYLNIDLYRYFIGRSDQSVNTKVMAGRIDQQRRVNRIMYESYHLEELKENKNLYKYMYHYLTIITTITCVISTFAEKSAIAERKTFWQEFKAYDKKMASKVKRSYKVFFVNLPTSLGHAFARGMYRLTAKIFKFV